MTFSVTVSTLLGVPSYQWYFNNSVIADATGNSLTVTNASVPNVGNYFVAVSDGILGGGNSSTATLTVTDLPPTVYNDAYTVLQNVKLAVAAPGVLTNDSPAFAGPLTAILVTNVSHGILNFYTNGGFIYLPATNYYGSDSFYYYASDGMSNSQPALVSLTVLAPPTITAQPQNQQVPANQTASFSVTASGTTPLSYQWYLQGSLLAGATSSTLTVSNVQSRDAGNYSVVVTNIAGSVVSTSAVLTIITPPEVSTLSASSVTTNSAVLNAALNPNGATTSFYFQYGLTTNYNFFTSTNSLSVTAQTAITDAGVASLVTGLAPGTVYHYTLVAANVAGTNVGTDATFQTAYLPPKVTMLEATNVTAGSATLRARVDTEGAATLCYFQYGTTTNYGAFTRTNSLAAGTNGVAVEMSVSNLMSGTAYHYSLIAVSSGGTSAGSSKDFSTLSLLPVQLAGATISQGITGQKYMQLVLTNVAGASFTVLGSSNLTQPLSNWSVLGSMSEMASGLYQFTDSQPATNPGCFYRVESN